MIILGLLAALGAAGLLFWWATRLRAQPEPRPKRNAAERASPAEGRFAGVEIRSGGTPCSAARALAGRVFLAADAPDLPLPDCTAERCRCAFEKRADRRDDARRWSDHGVEATITTAIERRTGAGRRRADHGDA